MRLSWCTMVWSAIWVSACGGGGPAGEGSAEMDSPASASGLVNPAIEVTRAVATTPISGRAALYLTLTNSGARDETLLAISTPLAREASIHETVREGARMVMRELQSLPLPADGIVRMEPGGLHIMLESMEALPPGTERLPFELRLREAGSLAGEAQIVSYEDLETALAQE